MPYEGDSDRELVARIRGGDTKAFEILHRRYYAKVYKLSYMQTGNQQDAEDVAAETFCRAFARIRQFEFRGCQSMYPWLHRIAVNLCVDLCRDRTSRAVVSLDNELVGGVRTFLDSLVDRSPSPEEVLQQHEVQRLVHTAIAALSPDQRDVVIYRFLGELSAREIAACMNRSEVAVKSLLHRGVCSLRDEIRRKLTQSERMQSLTRSGEVKDVRGDSVRIRRGTGEEK